MRRTALIPFALVAARYYCFPPMLGGGTRTNARLESFAAMSPGGRANASPHCLAELKLNCTGWIRDGIKSLHLTTEGRIIAAEDSVNATEFKLCKIENLLFMVDYLKLGYEERTQGEQGNQTGLVMPGGHVLQTTTMILKCNGAYVQFKTTDQIKSGARPSITCGHPRPVELASVVHDFPVLFGTDLTSPGFQHDIKDGLGGNAAAVWNLVQDIPDLRVLAGPTTKELYAYLLGKERVLQAPLESAGGTLWFPTLHLATVPTKIDSHGELPRRIRDDLERLQNNYQSDVLPCSVHSMGGFQNWRRDFSSGQLDGQPQTPSFSANGTLLYLQRSGLGQWRKGGFIFSDCVMANTNPSCNCSSVSEDEFVARLDAISRRLGLTMHVFASEGLQRDAEAFSKARVVVGAHGGAFTNIIFLDPAFDPLIIESNLHQTIYDRHQSLLKRDTERPRHFFSPIAASLGLRYLVHQPNIWEGYSWSDQMHVEVNQYLDFLEKAILGIESSYDAISAPFHPCNPWLQ